MDPQLFDRGNPTEYWFDVLARSVAGGGHSRRAFLGRTGAGLVGAVLAMLTPRSDGAAPCPSNRRCGNACCPSGARCLTAGGKPRCVCDATSCPSGCCQDGTCQPGTRAVACGSGGAPCQTCTGGTSCYTGSCVNLQTNRGNCGACGHICEPGLICVEGKCTTECQQDGDCLLGFRCCFTSGPTGTTGTCKDVLNDFNNCGACFRVCGGVATSCNNGECYQSTGVCQALGEDCSECDGAGSDYCANNSTQFAGISCECMQRVCCNGHCIRSSSGRLICNPLFTGELGCNCQPGPDACICTQIFP
jgi:hypothetical protein